MFKNVIARSIVYFGILSVLLLSGQGELRWDGTYVNGYALEAEVARAAADGYGTGAAEAHMAHHAQYDTLLVCTGYVDEPQQAAFQMFLRKSMFGNRYIVEKIQYEGEETWRYPVRMNTITTSHLVSYIAEHDEIRVESAANMRQIAGLVSLFAAICLFTCSDILVRAGKGRKYRLLLLLAGILLVALYLAAAAIWPDPFANW